MIKFTLSMFSRSLLQSPTFSKLRRYVGAPLLVASLSSFLFRVEKVPISERYHLVYPWLESNFMVRVINCRFENWIRENYTDCEPSYKIFPASHPETVRATTIVRNLAQGMNGLLKLNKDSIVKASDDTGRDGIILRTSSGYHGPTNEHDENNHNNSKFLCAKKHLEGREWKVIVADCPDVNAHMNHNYTIVIDKGAIDFSLNDDEVARCLGHEMGHMIGRHLSDNFSCFFQQMVIKTVALMIFSIVAPKHIAEKMENLDKLISSKWGHRREYEADYIGMMLMASAGYDPRAMLSHMRRYDDHTCELDEHPSHENRLKALENPSRMSKAIDVYRAAKAHQERTTKECV